MLTDPLVHTGLHTGCGCIWYNHRDHQTFSIDPTLSCSQGTCRHSVFEEVHLTFSSDLQTVLKAVNSSCINIILWQTVPAVDHSLREEVKTTITATAILHQFPRVSKCNRILSPFKESIPWNRWQLLHHLENFYNVCSVSPLLSKIKSPCPYVLQLLLGCRVLLCCIL